MRIIRVLRKSETIQRIRKSPHQTGPFLIPPEYSQVNPNHPRPS